MSFSLLSFFSKVNGQSIELNGKITDTLNVPLGGAAVVLLNAKDNLLEKYAITEADGSFTINRVSKGDYILQVSFLGFQDYSEELRLEKNRTLAPIRLEPTFQGLEEVTLEAEHIPIKISGDTINYNANAFKTAPNA